MEAALCSGSEWNPDVDQMPHSRQWRGPISVNNINKIRSNESHVWLQVFSNHARKTELFILIKKFDNGMYMFRRYESFHHCILVRDIPKPPVLTINVSNRVDGRTGVTTSFLASGREIYSCAYGSDEACYAKTYLIECQASMVQQDLVSPNCKIGAWYNGKVVRGNQILVKRLTNRPKRYRKTPFQIQTMFQYVRRATPIAH